MTKGNICDEVKKLLDMADSTNNQEESTRLANKVLELDPTIARLCYWRTMPYSMAIWKIIAFILTG